MPKNGEGFSRARAAAPNSGQVGSALDIFPAEDALFEGRFPETIDSESVDDRSPASNGPPGEIEDSDARKRAKPSRPVGWLIVALIVSAIPMAIAITLLAVAMPFGFFWLVYTGLIQPVIRTEAAVIVLNPVPRLMVFAAWLFMMGAGAVALIRGWDAVRGRVGFAGTDSVVWALAASVSSALIALGLSSWVVNWLLRFVR